MKDAENQHGENYAVSYSYGSAEAAHSSCEHVAEHDADSCDC
jgi:hypothetical protein